MNSAVKIIKRNAPVLPVSDEQKTGPATEREIAGTVKNWIAELAQRKSLVRLQRQMKVHM